MCEVSLVGTTKRLAQSFSRAIEGAQTIAEGIASIKDWQNKQLIVLGHDWLSYAMAVGLFRRQGS